MNKRLTCKTQAMTELEENRLELCQDLRVGKAPSQKRQNQK